MVFTQTTPNNVMGFIKSTAVLLIILLVTLVVISEGGMVAYTKTAIYTTGKINDFGFNYMVNEARILVERKHQAKIDMFGSIPELDAPKFMDKLVEDGYTIIIGASFEYREALQNATLKYPNVAFLARGGRRTYKVDNVTTSFPNNLNWITYNAGVCHYMMGYIAGLMTKTNILGYINPGLPLVANNYALAYFVGAYTAKQHKGEDPDALSMQLYEVGGWIVPGVERAATQHLIDMGADYISHSQDDMEVPLTIIENNMLALGTNGFPQSRIYGEQIATSFVLNWTDVFSKQITTAETTAFNVSKVGFADYGDLTGGFITLDKFSNRVPQIYQDMVINETLRQMAFGTYRKMTYLCNNLTLRFNEDNIIDKAQGPNCMSSSNWFIENRPYPNSNIFYNGLFKIPIVKKLPASHNRVLNAFSIIPGFFILLSLIAMAAVFKFRNTHSIRSASPVFCYAILAGGIITYAGVIVWVSENTTQICNARYWLLACGYALLIGALVVKNFRIWLIFDNPELKSVKITNQQLSPWVASVIAIQIILLAFITASKFGDNKVVDEIGFEDNTQFEYTPVCTMTNVGNGLLYGILASFAGLLILGVFVSWKIRIVDIAEFNESKTIANTLYAVTFCLFVIVPLMVSPQSLISQSIIICSSVLFITTSALAILFVPKFYRIWIHGADSTDMFSRPAKSAIASARSKSASSGHSNGMSNGIIDDDDEGDVLAVSTTTGSRMTEPTISHAPAEPTKSTHATFDSDDELPPPPPPPQEV